MPGFRSIACAALSIALVFASSAAGAKTDLRKPLHETHACTSVGRWCLQSNAWVNLHQRLLHEVRYGGTSPKALVGNDLAQWNRAVEQYRAFLGERHEIFDAGLAALNAALSRSTREVLPDSIPKPAAEA